MHLSRYLKVFPLPQRSDRFLVYSTLRGSLVELSARTLEQARAGTLTGPEAESLVRLAILVPDLEAEREQMRGILARADRRCRTFVAMVVLNLDCNLSCGYCYEEGFRCQQYMAPQTAELLVQTLVRDQIAQGKHLALSFYGGEPLLALDLIRSISDPLIGAAREHGVTYSFNLVTNGTLLNRETVQALLPLGLKGAKFTLDGPREIHDTQRPFCSGAGSYDAIVANLAEVSDLISVGLGGNFTRDNYREFPRLLDDLTARGITPDRLVEVGFAPITPKAGCAEYGTECVSSDEPWLVQASLFLRQEILSRGFPAARVKVGACMVEQVNNVVVNWDGTLYKCPAFMGWPGLSIGTLERGIEDYSGSHALGNWQQDRCLDCAYLPLCFGGCRFLTLLQGKGLEQVECKVAYLDAALETLVRQDRERRPSR